MKDTRATVAAAESCSSTTELLDLFEEAWQRGLPLPIDDLLACPAARKSTDRRLLLEELVSIDLEYRWRSRQSGKGQTGVEPLRLEEYVRRHTELGRLDGLTLELIGQEYRARHCWGDRPGHAEYKSRFATHGGKLQEHLTRIDAELATEFGRDRRGLSVSEPDTAALPGGHAATATPTTVNLSETLRSQQLL